MSDPDWLEFERSQRSEADGGEGSHRSDSAHLAELKDIASLIVQHLGAEVPPIAQPEEILEPVVAVADSPQESAGAWLETQFEAADEAGVEYTPEPEPTFEYVAASVAQIAAEPPATEDATDEPEMTDEQVERLEEQTAAALAEDVRELETVGDDRPARRFNPFANNPFA